MLILEEADCFPGGAWSCSPPPVIDPGFQIPCLSVPYSTGTVSTLELLEVRRDTAADLDFSTSSQS